MSAAATPKTRRPENPITLVRERIDATLSPKDWGDIFSELRRIALEDPKFSHKLMAIRLLAEYRFGKPVTTIEIVRTSESSADPSPHFTAAPLEPTPPSVRVDTEPRSMRSPFRFETFGLVRALLTHLQFPAVRLPRPPLIPVRPVGPPLHPCTSQNLSAVPFLGVTTQNFTVRMSPLTQSAP